QPAAGRAVAVRHGRPGRAPPGDARRGSLPPRRPGLLRHPGPLAAQVELHPAVVPADAPAGRAAADPALRPEDSSATLLLLANEPTKVVSERLGHSSVRLTLDTYSHVLPGMQEQAAKKLNAILKAADASADLDGATAVPRGQAQAAG